MPAPASAPSSPAPTSPSIAATAPTAFAAYQFDSRRVFDKLEALPKPTIAAIRGYALGGGFEIALCCDIIICATPAPGFGLPEGLLGLSPGGGGTQRLTRAVGKHMASDIMLAARRITGERAYQLGLAVELCRRRGADGDGARAGPRHARRSRRAPRPR